MDYQNLARKGNHHIYKINNKLKEEPILKKDGTPRKNKSGNVMTSINFPKSSEGNIFVRFCNTTFIIIHPLYNIFYFRSNQIFYWYAVWIYEYESLIQVILQITV